MSDKKSAHFEIAHNTYNLFGAKFANGVLNALTSTVEVKDTTPASNTCRPGVTAYPQPLNIHNIYALKDISGHHSSCIQAKKYASVGLGFVDSGDDVANAKTEDEAMAATASLLSGQAHIESKVDTTLDPLTHFGFLNELLDAAEDLEDTGTGYLEVHRNESGEIDGLTQVSAADVTAHTFNNKLFYKYRRTGTQEKYFSAFGKSNKEWLLSANGPLRGTTLSSTDVSELIVFMLPSNRVKFYGYPDWMSATVDIDLLKKSKQYKADFYHNRGVLDKVLVVTGETVESGAWEDIKAAIKGSIGMGNNFSSMALNFNSPDTEVQIMDMGAGSAKEDQFAGDVETLTQNIVSSHRVPPLLANILIPGKLGSSNEFINALVAFQLLSISPRQNIYEKMLAKTLGGPDGVEGLLPEDFRLRTITSQIDIASMDTIGKMRSEVTDGKNKDRDLSEGVKD